ncbi:MAG: hypothetical protein HYX69_17785 [Planctomycetia bacterium]|nr:hypothetical protein [Planctomycetia bacterium]
MAALKAKGTTVSSAQVSNIKASLRKRKGRRGRKAGAVSRDANGTVSLDLLLEAKKLADRIGGVEVAKRLLDALHRLS